MRTFLFYPSVRNVKGLSQCIADYLIGSGFKLCQISTETYCAHIEYYSLYQLPENGPCIDVSVQDCAVYVLILADPDSLDEAQKNAVEDLIAAGSSVCVTCDFRVFDTWFTALLKNLRDDAELPFLSNSSSQ